MGVLTKESEVRRVLETCRRVAVLGAHHEPSRAAFYVPEYLARHGYTILPVNPRLVGTTLWGAPVVASLTEVERADLVLVFRRSEDLMAHLPEVLAMTPRPAVVWQQLGIRNAAFGAALVEAGCDVVEDRCALMDHRLFGLP